MSGRPNRAFSRAAVFCALRMAFSAVTTKGDLSCRVLAEALNLFLDTLIYFGLDQTELPVSPAGNQLRRVPRGVEQQGFIRQRKIQRKKILQTRKKPAVHIFHRNIMASFAYPLPYPAQGQGDRRQTQITNTHLISRRSGRALRVYSPLNPCQFFTLATPTDDGRSPALRLGPCPAEYSKTSWLPLWRTGPVKVCARFARSGPGRWPRWRRNRRRRAIVPCAA